MAIKVRIPTPLQKLTDGKIEVESTGKTIIQLIDQLDKKYPGIKERICDEKGEIRRFINIFINEQDIRFLDGKNSKIKNGDEISIIPAIAGGQNV